MEEDEIEAKIAEEEALYFSALDLEHCVHVRDAMAQQYDLAWGHAKEKALKIEKEYGYCMADLKAAEGGK